MIKHQVDLVNVVAKDCPIHGDCVQLDTEEVSSELLSDAEFGFEDSSATQRQDCLCTSEEERTADNHLGSVADTPI
ncbi:MAG: hypothetical protein ACPGR2_02160 [Psychrobium sp.]